MLALTVTSSIKDVGIAWDTMRSTTEQFVLHQRSNAKTNEDSDEDGYILRRLIAASSEDSGKYLLSEKETVSFVKQIGIICA